MLRDEAAGSPALHDVLESFQLGEDEVLIDVKQFRMLTPNSFMWCLRMSEYVYYLYAVDFVNTLEEITDTLRIATDGTPGELVLAAKPLDFDSASPVSSSTIYEKPTDFDSKIAHYAAESGYDFVFLYRTDQRSDEYVDEL